MDGENERRTGSVWMRTLFHDYWCAVGVKQKLPCINSKRMLNLRIKMLSWFFLWKEKRRSVHSKVVPVRTEIVALTLLLPSRRTKKSRWCSMKLTHVKKDTKNQNIEKKKKRNLIQFWTYGHFAQTQTHIVMNVFKMIALSISTYYI